MFSLQTMFGKSDKLFDLLQASAEAALDAARAVDQLADNGDRAPFMATFIAARKREKELAGQISEELANTFVTRLDREDIEAMNSALYRIPKTVEKFAERYIAVQSRIAGIDFKTRTALLARCAEVVNEMVHQMHHDLKIEPMRKMQEQLQALEAEGDHLLLEPYRTLYLDTDDPMRALLAKDLFETIEKAIDRCRDVGNVIYSIVLKNS
ncbi:MAG: pit accessory protein [Nevskiaceae bacterium]|nr:MAG: pit accessory protein [Nevskiaceae bacterium]TBR73243.1 MAG: pit accessory protein [Nevskiaceae bacterium]